MENQINESTVVLLVATGGFAALIVFIVIFISIYLNRQVNQQRKIRDLEHQAQFSQLKASILSQEEERSRISRDLHDELGLMLSTVKLHLKRMTKKTMEESLPVIEETSQAVDHAIHSVRLISHNLSPAVLQKFGLEKALQSLFENLEQTEAVTTKVNIANPPNSWSFDQQLAIYRMVQELTNNIIKHANAKHIQLEGHTEPQHFSFVIKDNGLSNKMHESVSSTSQMKGIGLANIENRLSLLKGKIFYTPSLQNKSEFNELTLQIPLT
ncbi:MAG: sensor histidine kinase [Flavobacteriales bacterium]|jgi:signal transduction histidine kinase